MFNNFKKSSIINPDFDACLSDCARWLILHYNKDHKNKKYMELVADTAMSIVILTNIVS